MGLVSTLMRKIPQSPTRVKTKMIDRDVFWCCKFNRLIFVRKLSKKFFFSDRRSTPFMGRGRMLKKAGNTVSMMINMLNIPKQEKTANSLIAVILFKNKEPRPMEVVSTAKVVGNPTLRKHSVTASFGVSALEME